MNTAYAEQTKVMALPFAGVGYTKSKDQDGFGAHIGARFLMAANGRQRFGIEISQLDLYALDNSAPSTKYTAIGIVVEQTLWDWFLMSIGTIGYISTEAHSSNPFGIRTNLGWEGGKQQDQLRPFVVYRADYIFDSANTRVNSISSGIRMSF